MNIIVVTSRGRGLREIMSRRENTILSVHPGANLELLEDEALQLLDDVSDNTDTHVYFVAGLPDVTQRLKRSFYLRGHYRKYDEVTMPDFDAEKITKDIVSKYESTAVKIKKTNATPVFCTICPMSLATWNRRRLSQHRTAYLSKFPSYTPMQAKHEEVILKVNQSIHLLNRANNMNTPRLANPVIYRRKGQVRCRYGKLVDGVHPNRNLQKEWVDTLDKVIDLNTNAESKQSPEHPIFNVKSVEDYDSDCSEKHSWLYWWLGLHMRVYGTVPPHRFRFS